MKRLDAAAQYLELLEERLHPLLITMSDRDLAEKSLKIATQSLRAWSEILEGLKPEEMSENEWIESTLYANIVKYIEKVVSIED